VKMLQKVLLAKARLQCLDHLKTVTQAIKQFTEFVLGD